MKKTIFTLSLLLIAATLIFTGCSSKGDFELERSKGIKITYIDEFEKTTILPAPLTSEEIFNSYKRYDCTRYNKKQYAIFKSTTAKGEIAQKSTCYHKNHKGYFGKCKSRQHGNGFAAEMCG